VIVNEAALRSVDRPAGELEVRELEAVPRYVEKTLASSVRLVDHIALEPGFLKAYFESPPKGAKPGLLIVNHRDDSAALGIAAFARFDLHVDCLAPMSVQRLAGVVRRIWPGFLQARVLMFGLPDGLGGFDAVVLDGAESIRVRDTLIRESLELLEREHAAAVIWKELDDRGLATWGPLLEEHGFVRGASVPTVTQELAFASVDDYVAALRSSYRRQLRANLRRAARAGLEVKLAQPFAAHVDAWYPLFANVLDHSATRLETLRPGFFRALARDARYVLNVALLDEKLVGGALCTVDRGTLTFLFVGMDYGAARRCDLYFNLLYSVLTLAVERGCHSVHWGQTSLDAKGRFGGVADPLWFFFKFRRRWMDRLARSFGGLLFPQRHQTRRNVVATR
jgi:hypothetical protein